MGQKVLFVTNSIGENSSCYFFAKKFAAKIEKELISFPVSTEGDFENILKSQDVILVVCSIPAKAKQVKHIKNYLQIFRHVRMPYLFLKEWEYKDERIRDIMVPVNYLPEEKEKASWSSSLSSFLSAHVTLLQPNDRGSRARKNVSFIHSILQKKSLSSTVVAAKGRSDKIEFEALHMAHETPNNSSLLLISASREYGLDDIFFGPKELHVIKKASMPVLVINPRGDIYVLCGD